MWGLLNIECVQNCEAFVLRIRAGPPFFPCTCHTLYKYPKLHSPPYYVYKLEFKDEYCSTRYQVPCTPSSAHWRLEDNFYSVSVALYKRDYSLFTTGRGSKMFTNNQYSV
jgi:hypothetical protein